MFESSDWKCLTSLTDTDPPSPLGSRGEERRRSEKRGEQRGGEQSRAEQITELSSLCAHDPGHHLSSDSSTLLKANPIQPRWSGGQVARSPPPARQAVPSGPLPELRGCGRQGLAACRGVKVLAACRGPGCSVKASIGFSSKFKKLKRYINNAKVFLLYQEWRG